MRAGILLMALILLFVWGMQACAAANDIRIETLVNLFHSPEEAAPALFDDSFLAQVPPAKVIAILKLYKNQLGRLMSVTGQDGTYHLIFEKGTAPASIALNENHKISGLWFGNWTLNEDSRERILAGFATIPGQVSLCVVKNNEQKLLALNENTPLAVGSSFKLYVLKAVYDRVASGKLAWNDVILLESRNKSLPSGILQEWPAKTPVTLKTLTNLMISISDNTAADRLIDEIGRDTLAKYVSPLNQPFLKTGEMFKLKWGADRELSQKYIQADPAAKEKMLRDLVAVDVATVRSPAFPVHIQDIEWFFSTAELCQTIYDLKKADEITINPGLAVKGDWSFSGYKGGSEPGVLQYTHLLQKKNGTDFYAMSVTVNDPQNNVDEVKVTGLTQRLINLIQSGKIED